MWPVVSTTTRHRDRSRGGQDVGGIGPPGEVLRVYVRRSVAVMLALLALVSVSCGRSPNAPQASSIDLSGSWSGVVGAGSGGGRALRLTWSATQTGGTVSGPATLSTSPAVSDLTFTGTLSGVVTGTQLSLTYVAPAGSVSGAPECVISARGLATTTNTSMSGQFDVTFAWCDLLGLQPPSSNQFTLTKP
jgi:hypothetical protein